jgi:DNA gyrase subunit A
MPSAPGVQAIPLHHAASERYLNYALSVITSRALPDVRDGLKPVQRRILYTMFAEMSLHPGGRYRKCAAVVGEVMGKYHPHGDQSIYDALVRMAQSFSLRAPLVDGQGNFGSLDGDSAAAMRYTECKLRALAEELLSEIRKNTVDFRPNYDGQIQEPIVLPAQFPQLLVNGCEGIAVGMATRVPPHNLGEVVDAAIALIDNRDLTCLELMKYIKGPDFPTGGRILNDATEIAEIYEKGHGSLRVRGEFDIEREGRRKLIVIKSIPYGQNKSRLLERIGQQVREKRLPQVVDVRDESTDIVRVVIEMKVGSSPDAVMAYLYKRTPLEGTWPVNMTALIPSSDPTIATPERLSLRAVLNHWLDFRFKTVRRRFEYELEKILERIHILEGFALIFDALDEAIAIIRASEGKRDAAEKLMDRFGLSEIQVEAILELKLYRLARLEILLITDELEDKQAEAKRIKRILASKKELWGVISLELEELRLGYADERRTTIGPAEKALEYNEDAFIVKEDTYVIVTRGGWLKRQSSFSSTAKIRTRENDEIGWLINAHTRATVTFYSSAGAAYVLRIQDVPFTTGYGEPLQRFFNFKDGEKIVGVSTNDARHRTVIQEVLLLPNDDVPPPPYAVAVTKKGRNLRFALKSHEEISTRSGRRYARLGKGDEVLAVYTTEGDERVCLATAGGRAMVYDINEVTVLRASGKGTMGIKLRDNDEVLAFELAKGSLDGPEVITGQGRTLVVRERKFGLSKRGGRGRVVLKRGQITTWVLKPTMMLGPRAKASEKTFLASDVENDVRTSDEVITDHTSESGGEE